MDYESELKKLREEREKRKVEWLEADRELKGECNRRCGALETDWSQHETRIQAEERKLREQQVRSWHFEGWENVTHKQVARLSDHQLLYLLLRRAGDPWCIQETYRGDGGHYPKSSESLRRDRIFHLEELLFELQSKTKKEKKNE